jgi:peptidoglycan/LPS O-acetylase OafA/YrhL
MRYRPEIDGLRALAVLPVILFHAGFDSFGGGFVGVDVFFVISGYLITTIIISELAYGNFSIINFYERRARRILPALFFVMAVCLPFAWFWLTPNDLIDFGKSLIAVSTFSSNILFWSESGYFDSSAELKPLLHTWSLAVEEQYYILFPLFLILVWRFGMRWIIAILFIIFLTSLLASHWGAYNSPSATFYFLPTRGWELLVGVFAAIYLRKKRYVNSHAISQILSLIGFSMVIFSIFYFNEKIPFPSFYALVPTLGTFLMILYAEPKTLVFKILSHKHLVAIGLISYSAYLWHQPLLAFARHRLLGEESMPVLIFLCILSIVMAWFSWRFVEKPFRDKKITTRKTVFTSSLIGIVLFIFIGSLFIYKDGLPERVNLTQELQESFERPKVADCFDIPYSYSAEKWGCTLGAVDNEEIDFMLFGDSHSLSLKNIINDLGIKYGKKVFFTGAGGCIPFIGVYSDRDDQKISNCNLLNFRVYKFAKQEKIKGLILSARWSYYTHGDYEFSGGQLISDVDNNEYSLKKSLEAFSILFHQTIDLYNDIQVPIHIISQPPHQQYNPESLYFQFLKGRIDIEEASIKKEDFSKLNRIPRTVFNSRLDDFNLYDVTSIFCNNYTCPIGTPEKSFYYDEDHLSIFGAERLIATIDKIFSDT